MHGLTGSAHPTGAAVLDLDDPRCRDVATSGAKAAGLARARAEGLPVLDGFVLTADVSTPALAEAAASLGSRGSGAARMAIIRHELPDDIAAAVDAAARRLTEPLIVRSSSVLEGSGEWSGAFTSMPEVRAGEVARAARSVWATCFALDVLERFEAAGIEPGTAPMGVLVQPEIAPDVGGTATVDRHGTVTVTAVAGSPRDLLAGWVAGRRAVVRGGSGGDDTIEGDAVELAGDEALGAVARLARSVEDRLGHNLIEWAVVDGRPVLLQVQDSVAGGPARTLALPAALAHPFAATLARLTNAHPGLLGEELVLGWLPGTGAVVEPLPLDPGRPAEEVHHGARELAAALTAEAWNLPAPEAVATAALVLRRLRSDHPDEAIEALGDLRPVDPADAAALLGMVEHLRARRPPRDRRGLDRWEPLLAGVAALQGEVHEGTPAVGGIGAGRLVWVDSPSRTDHVRPRDIVVMQYPLANFAPLLWDAAGVVTSAGAPTAHLLEVARSLPVPAVIGCPVADVVRTGPRLGMVDGDAGRVALLAAPETFPPAGRHARPRSMVGHD